MLHVFVQVNTNTPESVFQALAYLKELLIFLHQNYILPALAYTSNLLQRAWTNLEDSCKSVLTAALYQLIFITTCLSVGQLNRLGLVSGRCIWPVGLNKKNSTACIRIIWLKWRHLTSGLTNCKNLWHCCNNDLTMKPSLWCLLGWNGIHLYLLLCFIEAIEKCVQLTSCTDRSSDMPAYPGSLDLVPICSLRESLTRVFDRLCLCMFLLFAQYRHSTTHISLLYSVFFFCLLESGSFPPCW